MRYLNQLVENIDMVTVESEMNTQCEIAEALYKESVMWNYFQKSMMYQEGNGTTNNNSAETTKPQKQNNEITTASDAWNATLGNKDEHIVFRIIAFLPRFIINFARWIGNKISQLFNKGKQTQKDVNTLREANFTDEEKQQVTNMLEEGVPESQPENEQPENDKGDVGNNDALINAINTIKKYCTTDKNGNGIEITPSSLYHNIFEEKLIPTITSSTANAAALVVPYVDDALSNIGKMAKDVVSNVKDPATRFAKSAYSDFLRMLDKVQDEASKAFTKIKETNWVPQDKCGNIPEVDASGRFQEVFNKLYNQLSDTGKQLEITFSEFKQQMGNQTKTTASNVNRVKDNNAYKVEYVIVHEGATSLGSMVNEEIQKVLTASMRFVTNVKTLIAPFIAKVQGNKDVIHCFAVVARTISGFLRKGREKKINKGIEMGYKQAMAGKEMTMVDGSKKKPGLFSRMFNGNKNNNQT